MIKKGLKNFVSSEKEMKEAERVLKAIKNSKTRLGKKDITSGLFARINRCCSCSASEETRPWRIN